MIDEPVLNEIRDYHQGRYISASEASWRLLQFSMHREFPSVQRFDEWCRLDDSRASFGTLRNQIGPWSESRELALLNLRKKWTPD